jgi:ubiquinone/menaquinone biosynthesis C-methylase UbiE
VWRNGKLKVADPAPSTGRVRSATGPHRAYHRAVTDPRADSPATPPAGAVRPGRPRGRDDFDPYYDNTPPWDIGRPQDAMVRLADDKRIAGRVLDVGCGTGEHTLLVARRFGGVPTGIDTSGVAIGLARDKARAEGLECRFLVADALDLPALEETFDTVLDCGLFHLFEDEDRTAFSQSLARIVAPGGVYYVLCFSDALRGDFGPRRVSRAELTATFARGWRFNFMEPSVIELTRSPNGVPAWWAGIQRI